jgi:small-conductance mechanosensitive channel/CRP-like cAMP-binding protein
VSYFTALWLEARAAHTPWLLLLYAAALMTRRAEPQHHRLRVLSFWLGAHLVALVIDAALRVGELHAGNEFRTVAWVLGAVTFIGAGTSVLFHGVLARARVSLPRIVEDVLVGLLSVLAAVTAASRAGANLSGIIATSAVITAVLGFSLQDVIGNVASGLALQLDTSIEVDDWIKVNDMTGRVVEVSWRHTAIETRNWETILVPNLLLLRNPVTVLGRRHGKPRLWRRWVYFHVDWRHQPSDVMEVVQSAVRGAEIARVATDPAPSCVLMDMADTYGRYALRYWLTDLAVDDPTDSEVRTRIYFALQRADIRLATPSQAVTVSQETPEAPLARSARQIERRKAALKSVGFFNTLEESEFDELACALRYAPFTAGEVITRQGAEAHWLYLVEEGTAAVNIREGATSSEVARLLGPTVFGEMSLLTGAPRSATVTAVTDVECFRLDSSAFRGVVARRPELAAHFAEVLATRGAALRAAREGLDAESARIGQEVAERDLFQRIRTFLKLD